MYGQELTDIAVSAHILVVDDEPQIRKLIEKYLLREGFAVDCAGSGQEMWAVLKDNPIDLVVLDLGLPDQDGFALTRTLRQTSDVAIIILTGKGEEVDRVVGLEIGADDYVVKPVAPRELLARIRSVLRRSKGADSKSRASGKTGGMPPVLGFQGWRLDLAARELFSPKEDSIHLTTAEFELLAALAQAPNQVLSRSDLLKRCAGREWNPVDRSVDIHIGRIRSKIEVDPKNPKIVKTIRGTGYVFVSPVEQLSLSA